MLPFCGYNMGDYFGHWVKVGAGRRERTAKLPKIYYVNWFRKDADGPLRVAGLRREQPGAEVDRRAPGRQGRGRRDARSASCRPRSALDTEGLDLDDADLDLLLTVDKEVWREEAALIPEHLNTFGDHTPKELWDEYRALVQRLG